jgi:hypothetical protein
LGRWRSRQRFHRASNYERAVEALFDFKKHGIATLNQKLAQLVRHINGNVFGQPTKLGQHWLFGNDNDFHEYSISGWWVYFSQKKATPKGGLFHPLRN